MSNWTHVAAIVRVDTLGEINFENIFGKMCLFEDDEAVWDDQEAHPDKYLPMGSEGSLQMAVYDRGEGHLCRYEVSIFGDLRDHDSARDIISWFKRKLKKLLVRQAIITVDNEWNGSMDWSYKDS